MPILDTEAHLETCTIEDLSAKVTEARESLKSLHKHIITAEKQLVRVNNVLSNKLRMRREEGDKWKEVAKAAERALTARRRREGEILGKLGGRLEAEDV